MGGLIPKKKDLNDSTADQRPEVYKPKCEGGRHVAADDDIHECMNKGC